MARQFDRHIVLRGLTEESLEVEREIAELASRHGFSADAIARTRIAMKEAISNAWVHGNRRDCSKAAYIDYTVNDREIRVRVADEGPGFDPNQVPDPKDPQRLTEPGGRGLLLLRELTTGVEYSDAGNEVEFWMEK